MNDYQCFKADKEELLRDFLEARISSRALKALKKDGDIHVNGIHQTVRYVLKEGDIVELFYPDESKNNQIRPWYFPLRVLYEDDYLMVVVKPVGMPSIPNRRYPYHTLANVLVGYYKMHQIASAVHLVSRLDKETGGIILVAKSRRIHSMLIDHFERRYRLLVEGKMADAGVIDAPIDKYPDSLKRGVFASGKRAVTHYKVIQSHDDMSLVEAKLETGRTHQIRVHFAYLGHPLIGDKLYGKAHPHFQGQALYSYYLAFSHPITHEFMVFQDVPKAFSPY